MTSQIKTADRFLYQQPNKNSANIETTPCQKQSLSKGPAQDVFQSSAVNKLKFAGKGDKTVTLAYNRDILSQSETKLQKLKTELAKREKHVNFDTKYWAIWGGIMGAFAEGCTAIVTLGSSLVAGGAGIAAGATAANWLSKKYYGDPNQIRQEIESMTPVIQTLRDSTTEAKRHLEVYKDIEKKAKTATNEEGTFTDDEYRKLAVAAKSDYSDIREKGEEVIKLALKVPGFSEKYQNFAKKSLDPGTPLQETIADLQNSELPEVQTLALRRLYLLEGQSGNALTKSGPIYQQFITNRNPMVAATALEAMIHEPRLRPENTEYVRVLEKFLSSNQPDLIKAGLHAVDKDKPKSGTINYQLRRLSQPSSIHGPEIRELAANISEKRLQEGISRRLNSRESANNIVESIVGNAHLKRPLVTAIQNYQGSLDDLGNRGPALRLYLQGAGGIGKTTMVSRIHNELNQNPNGLVRLTLSSVGTRDNLVTQLQQASPLQGKTIFLDEFQGLDHIKPLDEQARIIEFLKDIYATEDDGMSGVTASEKLNREYGLDLRNTSLAIATNTPLEGETIIREGKEVYTGMQCMRDDDSVGSPLKSRILSSSTALNMNANLRNHIREYIEHFTQKELYKYAASRHFDGNIELSEAAKEQLAQDLQQQTQHRTTVSGRDLTGALVSEINSAISAYEEDNNVELDRNENYKVIQPLTVEVDKDGYYIVKPR